jgi:hypothetical protein
MHQQIFKDTQLVRSAKSGSEVPNQVCGAAQRKLILYENHIEPWI